MAGDWIKMRVTLDRDPRVIQMADYLAGQRFFINWLCDPVRRTCDESAYEHVTRNVTVALCVTGLLVTWGVARERGDREDLDLVVKHCDSETVSSMSAIPCFGDAMMFVDWLREREDGAAVFPKFFEDNESPDDRHRRQAAERQARFRAKRAEAIVGNGNVTSNVTANVTVTHREEKRREENNTIPPTPFTETPKPKRKAPEDVELPLTLQTAEFHAAWAEWLAYRKERQLTRTPRTLNGQLAKLAALGPEGAAREIRNSISNGWQSVCYRETTGASNGNEQRHAAKARREYGEHLTFARPVDAAANG